VALNDVGTRLSPAWWMARLTDEQTKRLPRFEELDAWLRNEPPLPEGAASWEEAYRDFHKDTLTNVAALAVSSVRDRLTPLGFRTAASNDDNGDAIAHRNWVDNRMPVQQVDLLTSVFGLSEGYAMVGPPKPGTESPIITVQDPREVITAHDPLREQDVRAGMRTLFDPDEGLDVCYLYFPPGPKYHPTQVSVYRATRKAARGTNWGTDFRFASRQWTFDSEVELVPISRVPIVRFRNRNGVAEFEPHKGLLGRLNRIVLQRMLIGEIQAFRQRAVEGLPDVYPEGHALAGQKIDYQGVFTPGPGSMWKVPPGAKFWESQPIDLRPLLDEERLEFRTASALMGIPVSYFNPDDTNGSAEGASLQRESLIYRAEDRQTIIEAGLNDIQSLAFEIIGDRERMKLSEIETIWAPIERLSLTERYNAAVQAKAAGLANDTIRRQVLKMTPREMRQAALDDAKDMVLGVSNRGPSPAEVLQIQSQRTDQQPQRPRSVSRETPAIAPAAQQQRSA
jgi:hypothetical protein